MARYLSGLRVSAPIGTWVGVGGSLIAWGTGWSTLVGLVCGLVVLLLVGFVASLATAKTAKYRLFVTYDSRIRYLQKRVEAGGGPQATADLLEAKDQFDLRGPQWITGEGFVDVSRGVHKVEADLLDHAPVGELLDVAQTDLLRLTGSTVPNKDELLGLLKPPTDKGALDELRGQYTTETADRQPASPVTADAVKHVRQAVDEYRDSSREGIARLRGHTLDAVAVAGTLVYLLFVVVTAYGGLKPQLSSAMAFFLVGALVGLISALYALSQMSTAVEDFGLASVRLIANPILSGLCGVGGVLVISLVGAAGVQSVTGLSQIFDVVNRPVSLVLAAVFGVAPALLLNGLNSLSQRYASGLSSTQAASGAGGSTTAGSTNVS